MPFKVVRSDLTKMQVDVIVNTANAAPIYSSGTDTAVYKAAGEIELLEAREKIGYMEEGEVAITPGFNLPAKYIIHAVSPCYINGALEEEDRLRSCYKKSLELAKEYSCKSIAFPLIATGSFGYPKEEGMRVAVDEITAFLMQNEMLVYLVVFDANATRLGRNLYPDLESYIDDNYVSVAREEEYGFLYEELDVAIDSDGGENALDEKLMRSASVDEMIPMAPSMPKVSCAPSVCKSVKKASNIEDYYDFVEEQEQALKERMKHVADTFQEYLLYLIARKGLSNAEVYKRAIVTKQVFSKIKLNPDYHPDKSTAMRLCMGAKLNLDETKDLLARAGYALSPCDKRDIIFSFFIEREVYDMIELDIVLEEHDLPCFIE